MRSYAQRGKGEQLPQFITPLQFLALLHSEVQLYFLSLGPKNILTSTQQILFLHWPNLGGFLCTYNCSEIYFIIFIKDFPPIIPCTSYSPSSSGQNMWYHFKTQQNVKKKEIVFLLLNFESWDLLRERQQLWQRQQTWKNYKYMISYLYKL